MTPLRAAVDLEDGGRITSLHGRGGEWLLAPAGARDRRAFVSASLGGWDEMLPTIDPCVVSTPTGPWKCVDHGDAWSRRWVGTAMQHHVALDRLRLQRTIVPTARGLSVRYRLESLARDRTPVLWTPHPQLLLDDDATLDVGIAATWRRAGSEVADVDLPSRFAPAAVVAQGSGAKLWLHEPIEGLTLRRPDGWGLHLRWEPTLLPHLAIWIDRCRHAARQVIVVEPATSARDSLAAAIEHGSAWWIGPGATREWTLSIDELEPESA